MADRGNDNFRVREGPAASFWRRVGAYLGERRYAALAVAVASVASLLLRLRLARVLTQDPRRVLAFDPDATSYLRLFDLAVARFPQSPGMLDRYADYPWGLRFMVPPIWPERLALSSLPFRALGADPQRVAGLVALLVGVAIAIPVYFLARELFGRKTALPAALIAMFHPDFVFLAQTGLDHHVADVFLLASVFALFLVTRRLCPERPRAAFIAAAVGGLAAGLAVSLSLSMVLFVSMPAIPVVAAVFVSRREEAATGLASARVIYGVAAAGLATMFFTPWIARELSFSRLSSLHVLVLLGLAVLCLAGELLLRADFKESAYRAVAGAVVAVATLSVAAVPAARGLMASAFLRSVASFPLGRTIYENQPLFTDGLARPATFFSYFFFVIPVVVVALAVRDLRRRRLTYEHLFFFAMLGPLALYAVAVQYYTGFFSILVVIVFGLGISWLAHGLARELDGVPTEGALAAAGTAVMVIVMALPMLSVPQAIVDRNLMDMSAFIERHTVRPGDFSRPATRPGYGVMCDLSTGFQIEYLAERPVVATGNSDTGMRGILASERFLQARGEGAALRSLRGLNVRYVVVGEPRHVWVGDIAGIGEPALRPDEVARAASLFEISPEERSELAGFRLYYSAVGGADVRKQLPPWRRFKLLHVSNLGGNAPPLALYEVVDGLQ